MNKRIMMMLLVLIPVGIAIAADTKPNTKTKYKNRREKKYSAEDAKKRRATRSRESLEAAKKKIAVDPIDAQVDAIVAFEQALAESAKGKTLAEKKEAQKVAQEAAQVSDKISKTEQ